MGKAVIFGMKDVHIDIRNLMKPEKIRKGRVLQKRVPDLK